MKNAPHHKPREAHGAAYQLHFILFASLAWITLIVFLMRGGAT